MASNTLIDQTFADLRSRKRLGLVAFIPAGYPDLPTTLAALPAPQRGGASVIEVGFPFSDPIADGPTIQEAFTVALSKKLKVEQIFQTVAAARAGVTIPIVAMVSYSIVFRYGVERFLAGCKAAGFDGIIIPDLPPPEAQPVCAQIKSAGLDGILLISPTTAKQRRQEIAKLSTGFIYYMSISGITGERTALPADLEQNLREIRELTGKPVCVGFGISRPEHMRQLAGFADGAIVGSGIVKRMKQHEGEGAEKIAGAVEAYCRELTSAL